MTTDNIDAQVIDIEARLRALSRQLTAPRAGECLLCYVARMIVEFGCSGLNWAIRYRDLQAPRATALARRLGEKGAFCDCEIFFNGYQLAPHVLTFDPEIAQYVEPEVLPPCRGVRAGSVQPCGLWARRWRGAFG